MDTLRKIIGPQQSFVPVEIWMLLLCLATGVVLAALLRWHYVKQGRALSNRESFARNFVPLALAVILVISIVKTSLALSLGLVGALSIVRFRTPIKDPEELSYLFIVIAMGLGLGAEQIFPTVAAFAFILLILSLRAWRTASGHAQMLYLEVHIPKGDTAAAVFEKLSALLVNRMKSVNLERLEVQAEGVVASFGVWCPDGGILAKATEDIQGTWPEARITFLDSSADHRV